MNADVKTGGLAMLQKRKKVLGICSGLFLLGLCTSCGAQSKEPVTLELWHVYGAQTDSPLNDMIDTFNKTLGKEKGINVQVSLVSNTNSIHEAVIAASNNDPGASELPDMFISYPKTVLAMKNSDILVDYRSYFTEEELADFVPQFVEEGMIDGVLKVLPLAKSTEILFVNRTLFDRFAEESGAKVEDLGTWEGLFRTAEHYYDWTDQKTPDIPGDGKSFFVHDYYFNYFQVGAKSLGGDFFSGNQIRYDELFRKMWEPYARAAISGGVWLQPGYATEPLRTGDAIVSVASSASVLYYTSIVTYPDNTTEEVRVEAYPCPIFAGGDKMVMQRGAGICTVKSDTEHEQAAMTFLKWLTEAENNVAFVTQVGYMPVKKQGFDLMPAAIEKMEEGRYKSLYGAFLETNAEYTFYTAPQLDTYLELESRLEKNVREKLQEGNKAYREAVQEAVTQDKEAQLQSFVESTYQEFRASMP